MGSIVTDDRGFIRLLKTVYLVTTAYTSCDVQSWFSICSVICVEAPLGQTKVLYSRSTNRHDQDESK